MSIIGNIFLLILCFYGYIMIGRTIVYLFTGVFQTGDYEQIKRDPLFAVAIVLWPIFLLVELAIFIWIWMEFLITYFNFRR